MPKKVLITCAPFLQARAKPETGMAKAVDVLTKAGVEIVTLIKTEAKEYKVSDFVGLMDGVNGVIAGSEPWNEAMFKIAKDLTIVSRYGVGFDAVDLAKAKQYGVMVTNTRVPELSESVAEGVIALALAVYRELPRMCSEMKHGTWKGTMGKSLIGRTVGIVGFGSIGQTLARLLGGFRVRILASDPLIDRETAAKAGAELVPMDRLLAESDLVSVNAPNSRENHHLFNAAAFAKMKKGAILVNTARGPLVDEKALYAVLASGHLGGAGLDVWEEEPTAQDNPLLKLDNVVCQPHVSGITEESAMAIADRVVRQILDAFAGKVPVDLLNP